MNDLMKHRAEILRALENRRFEVTDNGGVLIRAGMNVIPMGVMDVEQRRYERTRARTAMRSLSRLPLIGPHVKRMRLRRGGGDFMGRALGSNVIPIQGLNHMLNTVLHQGTQVPTWFIALYEANTTPGANLTAANFNSTLTECTAYDETTRVAFNEGAAAGGVTDNGANRAVFTMNASKIVHGGGLLSVATKGSGDGVCFAAAPFSAPREVGDDDELAVKYTVTLTSA